MKKKIIGVNQEWRNKSNNYKMFELFISVICLHKPEVDGRTGKNGRGQPI